MKVISKAGRVKNVAQRWKDLHWTRQKGWWKPNYLFDWEEAYKQLLTATTEEEITAIMGNESWTWVLCDECERDVDIAVELGEEPYYDTRTALVCLECLELAVEKAYDVYNQEGEKP